MKIEYMLASIIIGAGLIALIWKILSIHPSIPVILIGLNTAFLLSYSIVKFSTKGRTGRHNGGSGASYMHWTHFLLPGIGSLIGSFFILLSLFMTALCSFRLYVA